MTMTSDRPTVTTGPDIERLRAGADAIRSIGERSDRLRRLEEHLRAHEAEYAEALASDLGKSCLLYTSPSPRDLSTSRMPSSA